MRILSQYFSQSLVETFQTYEISIAKIKPLKGFRIVDGFEIIQLSSIQARVPSISFRAFKQPTFRLTCTYTLQNHTPKLLKNPYRHSEQFKFATRPEIS